MVLTGKKLMFAEAILAGKTKTAAAVLAGYSAHTAAQSGSRLAKDVAVQCHVRDQLDAAKHAQADAPKPAPMPSLYGAAQDPTKRYTDPRDFLSDVMNDTLTDMKHRVNAAKTLMPFFHARKEEVGKKEGREQFALVAENGSDWAGLLQ